MAKITNTHSMRDKQTVFMDSWKKKIQIRSNHQTKSLDWTASFQEAKVRVKWHHTEVIIKIQNSRNSTREIALFFQQFAEEKKRLREFIEKKLKDSSGSRVVKKLSSSVRDAGSIPDQGKLDPTCHGATLPMSCIIEPARPKWGGDYIPQLRTHMPQLRPNGAKK